MNFPSASHFLRAALCAAGLFFISGNASGQNCSGLSNGTRLAMEIRSYKSLSDYYDGLFFDLTPAQQVAEARKYRTAQHAGTAKPDLVQVVEYAVSGPNAAGEFERVASIGGTEYKSFVACKGDTLYLVRTKGAAFLTFGKDSAGFFTNGVQVLPPRLKAGELTPGYVDERYFMKGTSLIRKTRFGAARAALLAGDTSGYRYSGYVPVQVAGPVESKSIALYGPGVVFGTGSITVSGRSFDYVKIRTTIWTKVATKADTGEELRQWFADPAFNKRMYAERKAAAATAGQQLTVRTEDMLGPNKADYHVTYREEWIAPALGMIRSLDYDQWGCLTIAIELKEIR